MIIHWVTSWKGGAKAKAKALSRFYSSPWFRPGLLITFSQYPTDYEKIFDILGTY